MARKVRRKSAPSFDDGLRIGRNSPKVKPAPHPAPEVKGPPTPEVKGPPTPKPDPAPVGPVGVALESYKAAHPKQARHAKKVIRAQRESARTGGDRPTPGGRTHGQDGRSGPDYRDVVKNFLYAARKNAGVDALNYTSSSTPTSHLEAELDLLRNVGPKRHSSFSAPHWYDKRTGTKVDLNKIAEANDAGKESAIDAGVHKGATFVLDQLTRPLHGIAGATDAAIKGENVLHAAGRGLANKDKTTFSKVLEDVGAPGIVQSVGGFGLDVALDPTTYVTLGAGSVLRKEAEKAAADASKRAMAQGLSEEQAAKFAQRAHDQVMRRAGEEDARGVTVKFAGREAPGIRRVTAKAVPRKVRRVVRDSGVGRGARHIAADVNPNAVPEGMTRAETEETTRAIRTARAKAHRGTYAAQQRALAIKKQIGPENYQRVIDALEAGDLSKLPPELREAAIEVRDQFRYANRLRRQAGLRAGEVRDRGRVPVPDITARSAEDTAREVARAQRAVAAAERKLQQALEERGVSQGRAEILSREVAGPTGETSAKAVRRMRVRLERAEDKVRTGSPRDVLRFIDEAEHAQSSYRGGASSVGLSMAKHDLAKADLATARRDLAAAEAAHADEKALRAEQRKAAGAAERENERRQATAKGYVPHVPAEPAMSTGRRVRRRPAGRTVKSTYAGRRTDPRPLSAIREEHPGMFSEDLPSLLADRMSDASTSKAKADLNRRLADEGRPVPRDGSELRLGDNEGVFHVVGSNLRLIEDPKELENVTRAARFSADGEKLRPSWQATQGGRFVILNRQAVDRALEGVNPVPSAGKYGIGRVYDKAQGKFKTLATVPNPGFHVRNLIGDTQNAYLGESAPKLARNVRQSYRALRELGRQEEALRELGGRLDPTGKGLKINGEHVAYADLVHEAEQVGAIRSGFIARELPELAQKDVTKGKDRFRHLSRLAQNREDVIRLSTYLGGRHRGLSPEKAAERAAAYHFDYSALTDFERNVARRVMPFWVFSARNLPLQFKSLVTKPGKYATYEKIREEAANAIGIDDPPPADTRKLFQKLERAGVKLPQGWESFLTEAERKNAGIPISVAGQTYTVSAGLPLADIGLFPGGGSADDWVQRVSGLLSPIVKDPAEIAFNYSTFFEGPIESDTSPLVTAPSFVGDFPDAMKKRLGIVKGMDKRSGQEVWRWPGKVGYIAHALPGPTQWAQQFSSPNEAKGGTVGTALAFMGVKAVPFDPRTAAINMAYERMGEIERRQAALRQQIRDDGKPISADHPTPEYKKLAAQLKLVQQVAYQGKKSRGDATLPTTGKPKVRVKAKAGAGGFDWGEDQSSPGGFDWSAHDSDTGGFDWGDN